MAVEFNEQDYNVPSQTLQGNQGGVTKLIMKLGLAKSTAQANIIMLIIAVIATSLAVYLMLPARATAPRGVTPTADQVLPNGAP